MCLLAVTVPRRQIRSPSLNVSLEFVKNKTYKICIAAVTNELYMLKFVPKEFQTYDMCMKAVKEYPELLEFVSEEFQTDEICEMAVKEDGTLLEYVKNKTPNICELAIKQNANVAKMFF